MDDAHVLFVPGPGFSARAEAAVLGPRLTTLGVRGEFWEEPYRSDPRPGVPPVLEDYVESLARALRRASRFSDLVVACHSLSVHLLLILAERDLLPPARHVLVAPALVPFESHCRVLRLAAADFERTAPEHAARIQQALAETRTLFDEPMQEGLHIAAEDPALFTHYWRDESAFRAFVRTVQEPGGEFRADAYLSVLGALACHDAGTAAASSARRLTPTIVLGAADPVIDAILTLQHARELFQHVADVQVFAGCGHWPHLEQPDTFASLIARVSAVEGPRGGRVFRKGRGRPESPGAVDD
jgi:pimeloyl-ACP methyl ester carboxylesterase